MSAPRPGTAGATRTCPHCKTVILESSTVCPSCKHYLRFDADGAQLTQQRATPLSVEGTIQHPPDGGAWEYTMVLVIRNDRGEEINRQVVGVGALHPGEKRSFSLAVEMVERKGAPPRGKRH